MLSGVGLDGENENENVHCDFVLNFGFRVRWVKMPPSPSLRWSPSRDTPQLVTHKRGHSFESGLLARDKDDDLALFNEVQNREQDNFLLHSTDDLDDSLSTNLRYFSDFKLGINIPARGETSDLLNANADKNDYDWLLTPPETPLFSSLDDEVPSINLPHRGRPRSQPISIPRPTTQTEKSNRASRSSASPHRLSPSPRSSSNSLQSRGRPLSVPLSTPILRPTTPSRSPSRSTTPSKPSTPAQRSTTPTPRRMSTGSSVTVASSGRTGTSPVKTNRGNSASPKLRAWQSNIPGFSTDVPPNLRTSLEDRPASYVRGSSPASRNGRGSSPSSNNGRGLSPVSSNARGLSPASRNGRESSSKRQSMSPTASRSASSSCSHDRDQFSSQSKGSIASSGDDDIDSLQSFSVSVSENLAVKKGGFPSSRGQVFSKKPSKVLSSSAPKRSFDSALRQMDRRSPQNMFRPLLSSVPSTTFYAGKASSSHRPVISRNSSITTSSTASSEQGASFIRDNESSDHDQDHGDKGKESCPDVHDEVFIFDKVDEMNEAVGHEFNNENSNVAHEYSTTNKSETNSGESENFTQEIVCAEVGSESTSVQDELSGTSCQVNMITCSKCGRNFSVIPPIEEYDDMCPHCIEKGRCPPLASSDTPVVNRSSTMHSEVTEKSESFAELGSEKSVPKLPDLSILNEAVLAQDETNDGKEQSLSDGKIMVEGENHGADRKVLEQLAEGSNQPTSDLVDQQPLISDGHQSFNVDVSQGVGISVLLKSSSSKWPVVQGRTFTASDDLSYTRESLNSMRSSVGHGSVSTSSSVDLSSSRQTDTRFQRQLSCRKSDRENSRHGSGTHIKPLSRGSSFSGTSNHTHHALVFDMSTSEENFDVLTGKMDFEALEETQAVTEEKGRHAESDSSVATAVYEKNKLDCTESCEMMDAPAQEPLSHTLSIRLMDTSVAMFPDDDCSISSANAEEFKNNASISDIEVSTLNQDRLPMDEEAILNDVACRDYIGENPAHDSSIIVSEEVGMDPECTPGSQNEKECSPTPMNTVDDLQELSVPTSSEKDTPVSASESCITDPAHDILEESTVTIRDPGGHNSRSLTLEEATDTILFCSSIIHDLAYQAAAIGMEKENLLSLEGSRPTVTILGKSSPSRKDRGRSINKRSPRLSKSKQKRVETTEVRPASPKTETDIKIHRSVPHDSEVPNRVDSVRPLNPESKCNCTVM